MLNNNRKYLRQLGLVNQRKLERSRIAIQCDGIVGSYLVGIVCFLGACRQGELILFNNEATREENTYRGHPFFSEDIDYQIPTGNMTKVEVSGDSFEIPEMRSASSAERCKYEIVDIISPNTPVSIIHEQQLSKLKPDFVFLTSEEVQFIGALYALVGRYGIFVGEVPPTGLILENNILSPSLAAACASLAVQFFLGKQRLIRSLPLERAWVSINLRVDTDMGHDQLSRQQQILLKLLGAELSGSWEKHNPLNEGRVYRIPIPPSHPINQTILESAEIDSPSLSPDTFSKDTYFSPFKSSIMRDHTIIENPIALPEKLKGKTFLLGGVGGLGSWIASLLACTKSEGTKIVIVDNDPQVEEHNLNRQLLYNNIYAQRVKLNIDMSLTLHTSLGDTPIHISSPEVLPKALFAQEVLRQISPEWQVEAFVGRIQDYIDRFSTEKTFDLVFAAFDNFAARYSLATWAFERGFSVVNAGGASFRGDIQCFRLGKSMSIEDYWKESLGDEQSEMMKQQEVGRQVCGREDVDSPVIGGSIVTNIAFISALQTLIAICESIGVEEEFYTDIKWWGTRDIQRSTIASLPRMGHNK